MQCSHGFNRCNLSVAPLGSYTLKIRWLRRPPSGIFALLLGNGNSLPLPLQDVFSLQLGHSPEDGQHKFPGGSGGVDSLLFAELYALKLDISTKMVAVVEIIRSTAHEQDHILSESEIKQ